MKKIVFLVLILSLFNSLSMASTIKNIEIYGHRGARGLAPENSLPAYKTGLVIGIDYVDMDVHMTKDKVVVVTHDFTLNPDLTRDSNGQWIDPKTAPLIKDLAFSELHKYDIGRLKLGTEYSRSLPYQYPVDGTHISSLKQVVDYVKKTGPATIKYQVEIKTDPMHREWSFPVDELTNAVVNQLKKLNIDTKTELQAFDWSVLEIVQKLDPKIATAYLTDHEISCDMHSSDPHKAGLWSNGKLLKDYGNSIPRMITKLGGKIWGPESIELTADLVKEAHSYGLKVVPWSAAQVDDTKEIARLIDIGVDGIISDRPDVVRGLLAARGLRVPKTQ